MNGNIQLKCSNYVAFSHFHGEAVNNIGILTLVCILGLVGCNNRTMNHIIENEPKITGIIKETNDRSILIQNEDGEYDVSLNVENEDSMTHFNIGDEVVVYYDGNIAESYPMQINKVYVITLKTPVDR